MGLLPWQAAEKGPPDVRSPYTWTLLGNLLTVETAIPVMVRRNPSSSDVTPRILGNDRHAFGPCQEKRTEKKQRQTADTN